MQIQQKEKKRAKFRMSFVFLFIFASFAICFTFYMKEDFDLSESVIKREPEIITEAPAFVPKEDKAPKIINPVQLSDKADSMYFKAAAVICGSQMKGLYEYGIVPQKNLFIDDGLSVRAAAKDDEGNSLDYSDLRTFLKDGGFGSVYFMTGMNDLGTDEEHLFDGIDGVIDELRENSPDTKIYFVSLLPVTASREGDNITNSNIDAYNAAFLRYANKKNIYYLDMNTVFVGNDGKMPDSLAEYDGIRLKKDTYDKIGEYILTHIGK